MVNAVSSRAEQLRGAMLTDNCVFRSRDTTRDDLPAATYRNDIYFEIAVLLTYECSLLPLLPWIPASTFAARRTRRTMSDLLRSTVASP